MKQTAWLGWIVVIAATLQGCAIQTADSDEDTDPPNAMDQMAMIAQFGPDPQPWRPLDVDGNALKPSQTSTTPIDPTSANDDPVVLDSTGLDSHPDVKRKARSQP